MSLFDNVNDNRSVTTPRSVKVSVTRDLLAKHSRDHASEDESERLRTCNLSTFHKFLR